MNRRILLFILFWGAVGPVVAQRSISAAAKSISSSNTGAGRFYYANVNEPARAIEFKERTVTAAHFLANVNQYFDIPAEFTFIEEESNTDDLGMQHRYLQQYYKGIPVEGMGYRVHEKDGFVRSANGKAVRNVNGLNTQVILSEEAAFQRAIQYLHSKDTVFRRARTLIVSRDFVFTPESFSVAYQFDVDVSLIEQWRISIDARSGQLVNKVSLVNNCGPETSPPLPYGTGTGMTNYYGSQTIKVEQLGSGSRLHGQTENGGSIATYDFAHVNILSLTLFYEFHKAYDFYSSNNIYNNEHHRPAVSVQWAAEQAYEYYFKVHNRNSFDNNGGTIKSYVHVDRNLNNAFWLGRYNLLVFGDGNNNNPLVELDVVSHELTHGITQYEEALQYLNEPGALNESFSDILGKAVEFYTFGDTATWQMAKHHEHGGMRDFSNPNLKGQPDTYLGGMWYTGTEDNGGAHTNSGVQNFWFYLLCEGGSGVNDHAVNYTVTPVGMDAAANIAYRNLTEYLSPLSDYLDSRIGSLLATADLYGKNSAIYQEVDKAWDAVGVIDEPIITSLEVYDITATTAMIRGSLEPRGDTVTYQFEYGTTPALGNSLQFHEYTGTVSGMLTELLSETKYYVRLVATNENGKSYASAEFTTISLAPLVKIKPTVDVTETAAVLYGEVNPNSLATSFYFEYGPTPALGLVTPTHSPLNATATHFQNVTATVTDLQPRQTYYYRLVAVNSFASSATNTLSLFTAVKPVISSFAPGTAPVDTEITITGQNFNASAEKNLVSFGATRAVVLSSTSTEIKVKVPAGASLGPVSLLDAESGLAAESVKEFVPTFTGEFEKGRLQLTMGNTDNIYQALVQDMDGDGRPDIIARHYLGFSVFLNVNSGGDVTDASFVRSTFNSEYTSATFSLIDFDGNGLKDIVGIYQNELRIYPNFSVPGYIFFGAPVDLPAAGLMARTAFNDFDMDGRIDIAGVDFLPGNIIKLVILRNQNPKGLLSADNFEERYTTILPNYVSDFDTDDLNNDGKPEILVGVRDRNFFLVLKNNSHPGTFAFDENLIQDAVTVRIPRFVSQDLNQDGWKDITVYNISSDRIYDLTILENKGSSSDVTMEMPAVAPSAYSKSGVQPGDLNGDGKVDLLVGLRDGRFIFLKNSIVPGESISESSYEQFGTYGAFNNSVESQSSMTINDLNGDGRPEVIVTYSYNRFPHEGYNMEIWQNGVDDCLDPSEISVNVSYTTADIVLPPNTTLDQFEIEYTRSSAVNWQRVSSTTLDNLWAGHEYQIRARAKCYLGFTEYYYINFTPECVNTNSFSIVDVGVSSVTVQAYDLGNFEVQYSRAGSSLWKTLPQYSDQITDLLYGTTYNLRFRGRCFTEGEFKHTQFTTLCPALSSLMVTEVTSNSAVVKWKTNYSGSIDLEYSPDNVTWTFIDGTNTMFPLLPATEYFVRGRLMCTATGSDYSYVSFTTNCPEVSTLSVDNITPFSATLNWVDEFAIGQYTATWSPTAGGAVTTMDVKSVSIEIDGLETGTEYTVAVAPRCAGDEKFASITFSTVCYAPFDLSVNAVTHTTAELSWSDEFGILPYSVDYSILGSNVWKTIETASTNVSLTELRPGSEYEARVHITCSSQPEPYVSLQFTTDLYGKTMFAPNPTPHRITIYPSENLIGRHFSIHDNTGRKVVDAELRDYTIDLSHFSPSVYILMIDGEKPMKIIKY